MTPRTGATDAPDQIAYMDAATGTAVGRDYKQRFLGALGLLPGHTVVNIGCGPGTDLGRLADEVGQTGSVIGVDRNPWMLADRPPMRGLPPGRAAPGRRARSFRWRAPSAMPCSGRRARSPRRSTLDAFLLLRSFLTMAFLRTHLSSSTVSTRRTNERQTARSSDERSRGVAHHRCSGGWVRSCKVLCQPRGGHLLIFYLYVLAEFLRCVLVALRSRRTRVWAHFLPLILNPLRFGSARYIR